MKKNIKAEIVEEYRARLDEADDNILRLNQELATERKKREDLLPFYKEAKAKLDAQVAPDRSVVGESPPPPASQKRGPGKGRQQDPHTKKVLDAITQFMLDAGEPVKRKAILEMLEKTEGVHLSAINPMRTLSGHLSNYDQFVNVRPGTGLWTLKELVDKPVPKEEKPPDVVQLNVYQQETNEGRNDV